MRLALAATLLLLAGCHHDQPDAPSKAALPRDPAAFIVSLGGKITPADPPTAWDRRGTNDERGDWFRDAKFGAFIHFGLYSALGGSYDGKGPYDPAEQIMGLGERRQVIPWKTYRDRVGGAFTIPRFDAHRWVRAMKAAGQRYVILTAKHHDGFCMWDTKTTDYNVVKATPFGRDVVKEVERACKDEGLAFCIYYSIGDWTAKDVMGPGYPDYRSYMQAQLRELLTNYPTAKVLWFDNWWYVDSQWTNDDAHAEDLYNFARTVSPGILVNDRCGTGVKGDHGDYATPENQLAGSRLSRYFEVVMTNTDDDNWGWVKGAKNYRTAGEVIRNLVDSASKGGNFVLNVGPNADGELPPEHLKLLEEVGRWTKVNGESIYGALTGGFVEVDPQPGAVVYTTASGDRQTTYVHVAAWPKDGSGVRFRLGDKALTEDSPYLVARLPPSTMAITTMLKDEREHGWMRLLPGRDPDPCVTVFRITRPAAR